MDSVNAKNKDNYVFISYSSKNQQIADSVRLLLTEYGIACWMAPYDIPAGSQYAYVINDALENCSCFLLLLTNDSQKSQFVERELERAISYKKPIIPMQLEDLELTSGFKFYIGGNQIIAVPEVRKESFEFQRILSGINKFTNDNTKEGPRTTEDMVHEKINTFRTQMSNMLPIQSENSSDNFCRLTLSSSYGGSIFFYSENSTKENTMRINITEEFWNRFVSMCQQILTVVFPGVSESEISIKRKKPLGIYECAPDDGYYYYDEKYRINFDVKYLHGKEPEKYDSINIDCYDGLKISLYKNGESAFCGTSEKTTLSDYGIDEVALYKKAIEMINLLQGISHCKISEKFRRNVYSDGSGGYILDYFID